jgi:hypothetical protein
MHISCTKDSSREQQQKVLLQINSSNLCDQRVPDLIKKQFISHIIEKE